MFRLPPWLSSRRRAHQLIRLAAGTVLKPNGRSAFGAGTAQRKGVEANGRDLADRFSSFSPCCWTLARVSAVPVRPLAEPSHDGERRARRARLPVSGRLWPSDIGHYLQGAGGKRGQTLFKDRDGMLATGRPEPSDFRAPISDVAGTPPAFRLSWFGVPGSCVDRAVRVCLIV